MVNYHPGRDDRSGLRPKSLIFGKFRRTLPSVAFPPQRAFAAEGAALGHRLRYKAAMTRSVALVALAVASCAAPPPGVEQQQGPPVELSGLAAAGPPARCVTINPIQSLQVSDTNRHVLLYRDGRTTYANYLAPYCSIGRDDVLVTEPTGSQYCRGDIVRTFDRSSRIPGPACILNDFVPYRRP